MDKKIIPIGKAAKYLGVPITTLRLWSNNGEIKPLIITPSGHRYYNIDDLDRFSKDIFGLAKDWLYSPTPFVPESDYYCSDAQTFQSRLGKLEIILKEASAIGEEFSLISLIAGEIGNNSFDHNMGQWPDIMGIFFAHDPKRKKIVLADRGQGIQKTLNRVRPEIKNDHDALIMAFTKFISGRAPESRGNGLKLVREVIENTIKVVPIKLYFQSGSAALILERGKDYNVAKAERDIRGCLVMITY
jgi:hypothetical protein